MTLGNDHNGTDGQTDGQTDRVRRNMRPPPREEGRITKVKVLTSASEMVFKCIELLVCIMLVETHLNRVE